MQEYTIELCRNNFNPKEVKPFNNPELFLKNNPSITSMDHVYPRPTIISYSNRSLIRETQFDKYVFENMERFWQQLPPKARNTIIDCSDPVWLMDKFNASVIGGSIGGSKALKKTALEITKEMGAHYENFRKGKIRRGEYNLKRELIIKKFSSKTSISIKDSRKYFKLSRNMRRNAITKIKRGESINVYGRQLKQMGNTLKRAKWLGRGTAALGYGLAGYSIHKDWGTEKGVKTVFSEGVAIAAGSGAGILVTAITATASAPVTITCAVVIGGIAAIGGNILSEKIYDGIINYVNENGNVDSGRVEDILGFIPIGLK